VPILVRVQQLQKRLLEDEDTFAASWNWIDAYLRLKHGEASALYRMLRQTMMARRALLLIDGIDEGGKARKRIERHIAEVLAPQGHVMVATSRPAGVDEKRYARFSRLSLEPLSDEQQEQALKQRLGHDRAEVLLPYLRKNMPMDESSKRITSNPLMLSLVASIFELNKSNLSSMPKTVAELYEAAIQAMLDRDRPKNGVSHTVQPTTYGHEVDDLAVEICFRAHLTEQRIISETHMMDAARQLDAGWRALQAFKERVLHDQLPLFTLLQEEPLEIQTAHLSFQEFLVARAICKGQRAMAVPAWHLSEFWSNTLKLGGEMGDSFGKGLLEAAKGCSKGTKGDGLYLGPGGDRIAGELDPKGNRIPGDRPTALQAVACIAQVVSNQNLSGVKNLDAQEAAVVAEAIVTSPTLIQVNIDGRSLNVSMLKGTDAKSPGAKGSDSKGIALDLSPRKKSRDPSLQDASAVVIAAFLRRSPALTSLNVSANPAIEEDGLRALGNALLERKTTEPPFSEVKCDAFEVLKGETKVDLSARSISPAAKLLLAGVLKHNNAARTLILDSFEIDDGHEGKSSKSSRSARAKGVQRPPKDSKRILNLSKRKLQDVDVRLIAYVLDNGALPHLETLNLEDNRFGDAGLTVLSDSLHKGALQHLKVRPYTPNVACPCLAPPLQHVLPSRRSLSQTHTQRDTPTCDAALRSCSTSAGTRLVTLASRPSPRLAKAICRSSPRFTLSPTGLAIVASSP
jgi:hypothetical protein